MGEVNLSEIALAQEGTDDARPLPKVGVTIQGFPLPIGLKAVPFLVAAATQAGTDLVEMTFDIPKVDSAGRAVGHHRMMITVPSILADAWAAFEPQPLADSIATFRRELQEADRHMEQVVKVGDHLAATLEMTNRFIGDDRRAIETIPKSGISLGHMIASAIAWWDKERHQEIGE